jgi:DNA-binding SARP family transcriptional activator
LCELLWPQNDADDRAHRLHLAASGARAAIRPACGGINPIVFSDGAYSWHPTISIERDTDAFERCFADGSPEALARAKALYVGEFLAGASADWILPLRVRYEHLYVTTIERLARDAYHRQDFAGAASYALDLVAVDRAHERATQLAMVCLAKSGRRGVAVREYQRLCDYLRAWLDVAPTAETTRLHAQIIDGSVDDLHL